MYVKYLHCFCSVLGGEDANSFSLVRKQGSEKAELLTLVELDYESQKKKYDLVVRAASPPLRNDAHVEILVTDVNDNAPQLKDFQVFCLFRLAVCDIELKDIHFSHGYRDRNETSSKCLRLILLPKKLTRER